jgi:hypothetical protein
VGSEEAGAPSVGDDAEKMEGSGGLEAAVAEGGMPFVDAGDRLSPCCAL